MTAETLFLERQIVELALIGREGFHVDHGGADGLVLVLEEVGEFDAADGVDALFERENPIDAPLGIGDVLGQFLFAVGDGAEFGFEAGDVLLVLLDVIGGQQDGAAGERGADRIVGGLGAALFGLRTRR